MTTDLLETNSKMDIILQTEDLTETVPTEEKASVEAEATAEAKAEKMKTNGGGMKMSSLHLMLMIKMIPRKQLISQNQLKMIRMRIIRGWKKSRIISIRLKFLKTMKHVPYV